MSAAYNHSEGKTPRFTSVSPLTGKAYMAAAHKWCLRECALIVPLFINGLAPIEMMEHELPLLRRALLARKAGRYKDKTGQLAEESQTVEAYRQELISNTLKLNEEVCQGDEDAALELLFPSSGIKSRDNKRSQIETQAQGFMQCLMLLWPSEEVQLAMSLDGDLIAATELNDLIAWTIAFDKFCVSNAGNKFFNVREAELALKMVKMKGYDTPNFVRAFKQAALDARTCGSVQSEEDVVAQFFLNMNQSSDAFYRYEFRYLDESDLLHSFISKPLQAALDHAMSFHKTTILSALARKKADVQTQVHAQASVTSLMDLEKLVSDGAKRGTVSMPHAVMMTLYNNNNKRKTTEVGKSEAEIYKKKVKFEGKSPAESTSKDEKKKLKCYRFPTKNGCKFGDDCKFAHIA